MKSSETRDSCLTPYHMTFASLNKVKYYRDFKVGVDSEIVHYLEREAQLTISKLKKSLLYSKGIITDVTFDINISEQIIYFDIMLRPGTAKTRFIELLGFLDHSLKIKDDNH